MNSSQDNDARPRQDSATPPAKSLVPTANHTESALKQLVSFVKTLYHLAPAAVEAGAILIFFLGFIVIHFGAPLEVISALVVFSAAVGVYAVEKRFGEAAIALVAGMLPVLTTDWNAERFAVFVASWVALGLGGLLVRSVAMASKSEKLYFHAAVAAESYLGEDGTEVLKRISEEVPYCGLGPIEKGEVLREFAYRKVPPARMAEALEACGQFSALWDVDHRATAVFVADLYRMFREVHELTAPMKDQVYVTVRDSLVSPSEFLHAFAVSKRLALSGMVNPVTYLILLPAALHDGVPPEEIYSYITEHVGRFVNPVEPEARGA